MWNKQKPKADLQRYSGKTSIIATGAELVGDLRFQGAVQVDGRLTGNLSAVEGMVRISVDGLVQGEIRAPHVIIDGEVQGDVYASEHLELGARARVKGTVLYGLMEMAMGAQIDGRLGQIKESAMPLELPSRVDEADA